MPLAAGSRVARRRLPRRRLVMTRSADTPTPAADSPLPPVYSRLSAAPLPGGVVEDGAPARPYYGPGGLPPRDARPVGASPGPGRPDARVEPSGTVNASVSPRLIPVLDRTAAHGAPLAHQPDDVAAVAGAEAAVETVRAGGPSPSSRGLGERDRALADLVADRLERLAARIRAEGHPRLARATDTGEPLDAVLVDIVGDYLRDRGA